MRRTVGYVMSRSNPRRISFVATKGSKVGVGNYYVVKHPWKNAMVFLRAIDVITINDELDVGGSALIASSSGLLMDYTTELEYLVVICEVLGYRDEVGAMKPLEAPPSTLSPVMTPTDSDVAEFFSSTKRLGLPITIGRIKGTKVKFPLDLSAVSTAHMFVTGMTRSGKSVTRDTMIVLYDSTKGTLRITPIGSFIDGFFSNGEEGVKDVTGSGLYTLSLDSHLRPRWSKIRRVIRHRADKRIYKVTTATGKSVKVTEDHSLLVTIDGSSVSAVTPRDLMLMKRKYLISPWNVQLPEPKDPVDPYIARLLGISLANGVSSPRYPWVYIFEDSVGEAIYAAEEAGLDYRVEGKNLLAVRSEILTQLMLEGLNAFFHLPWSYVHFTGIDLQPRKVALMEFFHRTSLPTWGELGEKAVFYSDVSRLVVLLNLLGMIVTGVGENVVWIDPVSFELSVLRSYREDGRVVSRYFRKSVEDNLREEDLIVWDNVILERVVSVEEVPYAGKYVYDLSVEMDENFLANGVFVHNSSFVSTLLTKALNADPKPHFLVLDRRGEYVNGRGRVFDYSAFIPAEGYVSPYDVATRLGLRPNTTSYLLLTAALTEVFERGDELDKEIMIRALRRVAREMRVRPSLLTELEVRLRRADLGRKGGGLDVVEVVREHPLTIVDLSSDARYEDQFRVVRDMVRRLTNYAVERRSQGDFALIVVVEEAQYLVPERGYNLVGDPYEVGAAQAIIEAVSQAGGYNLGFIVVTQRPAYVAKNVISQANTVVAFRLRNGNDQEAMEKYTEVEGVREFLPGLSDHEALVWGMASPLQFPVVVETEVVSFPSKAKSRPEEAWRKMG